MNNLTEMLRQAQGHPNTEIQTALYRLVELLLKDARSDTSPPPWERDIDLEKTVEEFIVHVRRSRDVVKPHTIRWYRYILGCFLDWCEEEGYVKINELDTEALVLYAEYLKIREVIGQDGEPQSGRGLTRNTRRGHVIALRRFGRWLHEKGYTYENITRLVHIPSPTDPPPRKIDPKTVRALMRAAYERDKYRELAMLFFLRDSGARIGEVLSLTWENLDLDNMHAHVFGKGDRWRVVYFLPAAANAFRRYRGTLESWQTRLHAPVFWSFPKGDMPRPMNPQGARMSMLRLSEWAGVEWRGFHLFRFSYSQHKTGNGVGQNDLMQLLGHRDPRTTATYTKRDPESLRAYFLKAHEGQDDPVGRELGLLGPDEDDTGCEPGTVGEGGDGPPEPSPTGAAVPIEGGEDGE